MASSWVGDSCSHPSAGHHYWHHSFFGKALQQWWTVGNSVSDLTCLGSSLKSFFPEILALPLNWLLAWNIILWNLTSVLFTELLKLKMQFCKQWKYHIAQRWRQNQWGYLKLGQSHKTRLVLTSSSLIRPFQRYSISNTTSVPLICYKF